MRTIATLLSNANFSISRFNSNKGQFVQNLKAIKGGTDETTPAEENGKIIIDEPEI